MTAIPRPGRLNGSVEIVLIGDELLLGAVVDRNGPWLSHRLALEGIVVRRIVTVGDDEGAIRDAIDEATRRTGTVICTGGLGATTDDRTRDAAAAVYGVPLLRDAEAEARLRARYAPRDLPDPALLVYADVPRGARVLPNPAGLAPGLILEDDARGATVLLPGVPSEVRALFEAGVLPWLRARWPDRGDGLRQRTYRTTGLTESALARRIAPLRPRFEPPLDVAFLPNLDGVDLRLTYWGRAGAADVEAAFERADAALGAELRGFLYGLDGETLVDALARRIEGAGLTLAVAESCTGGLIGARITARPGSSAFFVGGAITYSNEMKTSELGVAPALITTHGAVSEPVARAMAEGAATRFGADASIAVTGIAGPGGGTPTKPVGTVWIATSVRGDVRAEHHLFRGDREDVRARAAQAALAALWRRLE